MIKTPVKFQKERLKTVIGVVPTLCLLQSNLDGSNIDGSFTMANSNSFFETLRNSSNSSRKQIFKEILFYREIVCCVYSLESPHRGDSNEYTQHTITVENRKYFPKLSLFASWTGAMINPQWLELPMSRTNFHGPKDVRAIEVRLYVFTVIVLKHGKSLSLKCEKS